MTLRDPGYFLYHSIGQYPGKADEMAAALGEFSQVWGAMDDVQWPQVLTKRMEFIEYWRALLEAPKDTLTSAENVTTGLFSILGGLPPERLRGKRVLIAADCFPSLHFLLNGLGTRMGFTLHTVPTRQGEFWVRDEDMIAAWGPDVGLALLTWVTSTSSHRCDLATLAAHGAKMGSLVGVDLTQGIGIIPFSLKDYPVDFLVASSLKWLCGTPGAGIIQMRADVLADVKPELRGWFSQENPFSWDLDAFDYASDARRLDNGTPSVLACLGSIPALRWHAAQTDLLTRNRDMTAMIIEEARSAGWMLASPAGEDSRGGSVMLKVPGGVEPETVIQDLLRHGLLADCRGQILRLSPGAVTKMHHVERLCQALHTLY